MPAICETDELIEQVTIPAQEQAQVKTETRGVWKTLVHKMGGFLKFAPEAKYTPLSHRSQPFETSMDRMAREHPALSCAALGIV